MNETVSALRVEVKVKMTRHQSRHATVCQLVNVSSVIQQDVYYFSFTEHLGEALDRVCCYLKECDVT